MIGRVGMLSLMALLITDCRKETVGEAIQKLRSDSYVRILNRGNHILEVRFIPETLYFLTYNSLDPNRPMNQSLLDSVKAKGYLSYGLMFTLTLGPMADTLSPLDFRNDVVFGQLSGQENYRAVLDDFLSGLPYKIWLETGGRRFRLRTFHMTNSWGMEKSRVFTLLFDPVPELLPKHKGRIALVIENLVPGQARDKVEWDLPISRNDFI